MHSQNSSFQHVNNFLCETGANSECITQYAQQVVLRDTVVRVQHPTACVQNWLQADTSSTRKHHCLYPEDSAVACCVETTSIVVRLMQRYWPNHHRITFPTSSKCCMQTGMASSPGSYRNQNTSARFSDTPILGEPTNGLGQYPVPRSRAAPPDHTGRQYRTHVSGDLHRDWSYGELGRHFTTSSSLLPLIACVLLIGNHIPSLWRLIQKLGTVDCIAIACLALYLLTMVPRCLSMALTSYNYFQSAITRLPGRAEQIVPQVWQTAMGLVTSEPAPKKWLDMYYNMVSDIDNLLQEMQKMNALMLDMHNDVDYVKAKTAWLRFKSSKQYKHNDS